jgi:hypothetical protein
MVVRVMPQSFLFPVEEWNRATAASWLRAMGYKTEKVVKEANHYRARQFDPNGCSDGWSTKVWWSRRNAAGRGRRKAKKILAVFCRRND